MVGKPRSDRIKMKDIGRQLGAEANILVIIERRRLNWFGHHRNGGKIKFMTTQVYQYQRPKSMQRIGTDGNAV